MQAAKKADQLILGDWTSAKA